MAQNGPPQNAPTLRLPLSCVTPCPTYARNGNVRTHGPKWLTPKCVNFALSIILRNALSRIGHFGPGPGNPPKCRFRPGAHMTSPQAPANYPAQRPVPHRPFRAWPRQSSKMPISARRTHDFDASASEIGISGPPPAQNVDDPQRWGKSGFCPKVLNPPPKTRF
jgi:hypothetical protein